MLLFLGLIFGSVGGVYAFYGRREHSASYLVCGVALMLYPYFVASALLMIVVGVVIAVIPIAIQREWF
jgi:predicted lysophospholipase L1 biosynthesis ABC-type transport system permease subunit